MSEPMSDFQRAFRELADQMLRPIMYVPRGHELIGTTPATQPSPEADRAEHAMLGRDRNGEPVRNGDYLGRPHGRCVMLVRDGRGYWVRGDNGEPMYETPVYGELLNWVGGGYGYTRARARELGYPAQEPMPEPWADEQVSARAGESAIREDAGRVASPAPVPDCAACFTCGADVPIAALITDLYDGKTKCVYCDHRIRLARGPDEKWLGPAPAPEPYEEHGAWESCCWDGDG